MSRPLHVSIVFDTGNEAFDGPDLPEEAQRIVLAAAARLLQHLDAEAEEGDAALKAPLKDRNGSTVGFLIVREG